MAKDDYHYNETVLAHVANPKNVGEIPDADGTAYGTNPACGDEVKLYLKLDGERIALARVQLLGCGAITAAMSSLTETLPGKTLEEARALTPQDIADSVGGLPSHKRHCSVLAARILKDALWDAESKRARGERPPEVR